MKWESLTVYAVISLIFTLFLFYVDEANYNLKWMLDFGNWIPFIIYTLSIFFAQIFFSGILFKRHNSSIKIIYSVFAGTITGVCIVIFGIFTNW